MFTAGGQGEKKDFEILNSEISVLALSFAVQETYLIWKVPQLAILALLILKAKTDNSNAVRNT